MIGIYTHSNPTYVRQCIEPILGCLVGIQSNCMCAQDLYLGSIYLCLKLGHILWSSSGWEDTIVIWNFHDEVCIHDLVKQIFQCIFIQDIIESGGIGLVSRIIRFHLIIWGKKKRSQLFLLTKKMILTRVHKEKICIFFSFLIKRDKQFF